MDVYGLFLTQTKNVMTAHCTFTAQSSTLHTVIPTQYALSLFTPV